MKNFYLSLVTALLALCSSFAAVAANGGTISWNIPGAVDIYTWNSTDKILESVNIADDATEYTVAVNMKSHYVYVRKEGYTVASFEGVKPNGQTQTITKSSPYGYDGELNGKLYAVTFNGSNAGTDFKLNLISDEEAGKEATFTLSIENGAELISAINIGSRDYPDFVNGQQTVTFKPALENNVVITVRNGKDIYSVRHNNTEVAVVSTWGSKSYTISNVKQDDVIIIRGYEEDPEVETCKITLETTGAAAALINGIWNTTTLKTLVAGEDGSYTVNKGDKIRVNFKSDYEDYNITVTANGTAIEVAGGTSATFAVEADTKITVSASEKVYGENTWTIYIANPEGVNIGIGAGSAGGSVDLSAGGEKIDTPVEFKAATEAGVIISPAMTVPSDNLYKYTVKVSEKYPTLMATAKGGYHIVATRNADLSTVADNPISSKTFYVYARKITRSAKMAVYVEKRSADVYATVRSASGEINERLENGYVVLDFDPGYDNPFRFGLVSTDAEITPAVIVEGEKATADENGIFNASAADGYVVKMFEDLGVRKPKIITVTKEEGADAVIVYDKVKTHIADGSTSTFSVYSKSEIAVTPDAGSAVTVDGENVTLNEDGTYIFNTTGEHTIAISKKAAALEYVLEPASGSTVESLDKITLSFPTAANLEQVLGSDEIMFQEGQAWAATSIEVKAVEGAPYPTFEIIPVPAPSKATTYHLFINEGMFAGEGNASPAIEASYTLKKELGDLNVQYTPMGDIQVGQYHASLTFVFDENFNVARTADFANKVTVKFDSEVLPASKYEVYTEANYLMFMLSDDAYLKPGKVSIAIAAGAISLSGTVVDTDIEHSWTYIEPKNYTVVLTPAPGTVSSLDEITIVIDGAETAEVARETGISIRKNRDYTWGTCNATVTAVEGSQKPTFLAKFSKAPAEDGEYIVTISYSTFGLDGSQPYPESNDEYTYTLKASSGIDSIIAEADETGEIYNLQGIRLSTKWSDLPAGIYIVKGRKVAKH